MYKYLKAENVKIEKCDNVYILTIPGRKEVGPYVERLIGQLEEAQDAISCRAAWVAIARDDAVLMEHLETINSILFK